MKPAALLAAAALFAFGVLPALAQTDAGTPPVPNANAPLPDSLKVTPSAQPSTLTLSKPQIKPGQPVRMTFLVVNTSGKPVTYNFPTGQRFDITAANAAGTAVWNWAASKRFSQNLASLSLPPGKSFVYQAVWNGRDLSGIPSRRACTSCRRTSRLTTFPPSPAARLSTPIPTRLTWASRLAPPPRPEPSVR